MPPRVVRRARGDHGEAAALGVVPRRALATLQPVASVVGLELFRRGRLGYLTPWRTKSVSYTHLRAHETSAHL
eukprot:13683483-Alexandrium_andersonii.AAC.1